VKHILDKAYARKFFMQSARQARKYGLDITLTTMASDVALYVRYRPRSLLREGMHNIHCGAAAVL